MHIIVLPSPFSKMTTYRQGELQRSDRIRELRLFLSLLENNTIFFNDLLLRTTGHDHPNTRKALASNSRHL